MRDTAPVQATPEPARVPAPAALASSIPGSARETLSMSGEPLEPRARARFESQFGHDFSRVRLHTDRAAADSAQLLGAQAWTAGSHIVFGAGRYAAGSSGGSALLSHELAHVVQQDVSAYHATPDSGASRLLEGLADQAASGERHGAGIAQRIRAPVLQRKGLFEGVVDGAASDQVNAAILQLSVTFADDVDEIVAASRRLVGEFDQPRGPLTKRAAAEGLVDFHRQLEGRGVATGTVLLDPANPAAGPLFSPTALVRWNEHLAFASADALVEAKAGSLLPATAPTTKSGAPGKAVKKKADAAARPKASPVPVQEGTPVPEMVDPAAEDLAPVYVAGRFGAFDDTADGPARSDEFMPQVAGAFRTMSQFPLDRVLTQIAGLNGRGLIRPASWQSGDLTLDKVVQTLVYVNRDALFLDRSGHLLDGQWRFKLAWAPPPGVYFSGVFDFAETDDPKAKTIGRCELVFKLDAGGQIVNFSDKVLLKGLSVLQDQLPMQEIARAALQYRTPEGGGPLTGAGLAIIVPPESATTKGGPVDNLMFALISSGDYVWGELVKRIRNMAEAPVDELIGLVQELVMDAVGNVAKHGMMIVSAGLLAVELGPIVLLAGMAHSQDEVDIAAQAFARFFVEEAIGELGAKGVHFGGKLAASAGSSIKAKYTGAPPPEPTSLKGMLKALEEEGAKAKASATGSGNTAPATGTGALPVAAQSPDLDAQNMLAPPGRGGAGSPGGGTGAGGAGGGGSGGGGLATGGTQPAATAGTKKARPKNLKFVDDDGKSKYPFTETPVSLFDPEGAVPAGPGKGTPFTGDPDSAESLMHGLANPDRLPKQSFKPKAVGDPDGVLFAPGHPVGTYASSLEAFIAYRDTVFQSAGMQNVEVGLYYNADPANPRFSVIVGDANSVTGPKGWHALIHYHPNPDNAFGFRLPSVTDFMSVTAKLIQHSAKTGAQNLSFFIEYPAPAALGTVPRYLEYGIDGGHPGKAYFVTVHFPDGSTKTMWFKDMKEYKDFYDMPGHEKYLDPEMAAALMDEQPDADGAKQQVLTADESRPIWMQATTALKNWDSSQNSGPLATQTVKITPKVAMDRARQLIGSDQVLGALAESYRNFPVAGRRQPGNEFALAQIMADVLDQFRMTGGYKLYAVSDGTLAQLKGSPDDMTFTAVQGAFLMTEGSLETLWSCPYTFRDIFTHDATAAIVSTSGGKGVPAFYEIAGVGNLNCFELTHLHYCIERIIKLGATEQSYAEVRRGLDFFIDFALARNGISVPDMEPAGVVLDPLERLRSESEELRREAGLPNYP